MDNTYIARLPNSGVQDYGVDGHSHRRLHVYLMACIDKDNSSLSVQTLVHLFITDREHGY